MSTIKISQLPSMPVEASNTSNTILLAVDLVNSITGTITATSLAQGLYSNNPLAVGNNIIQLPNTVAQFSGNGASYLQTNLLNTNETGTADMVVTANSGTDSTYFIDMGYANKNYQPGQEYNNIGTAVSPLDGYIYAQGVNSSSPGGNLIVGSTTSGREVRFVAGGGTTSNVIYKITANGLYMMNGMPIYFADGTLLASANTISLNSAIANTVYTQGVDATQNNSITASFNQANTATVLAQASFNLGNTSNVLLQSAFNTANSAAANTIYSINVDLTQNNIISAAFNLANNNNLLAQGAYNTANAALPLSGGTVTGPLTTGILIATSNVTTPVIRTANSTSSSPNKNLSIVAGSDTLYSGGIVTIQSGDARLLGGVPGNINLIPGSGGSNNTNGIVNIQGSLTLTGNLIANSAGQGIFVDKFTSNSATFSQNMVVLGNLTANTLLGNIFFSNVVTTTSQSNSILWFPQAGTLPQQTAQLWYYSNTQSLILDTDIAGDRLSISKVLFFRAFNNTGSTIPANSFVRLVPGVTANQIPYIALADATNSANATVAGFVKNAIANGAYGFVYSQGIVEDLNSTGLGQNGDILFLSTTPGLASNVAPQTSNSNTVVQLGRVILSDATQGKLFIQNQLRQAYGRPNGSVLYAYANNINSSNTISINDSTGTFTANTIVANTLISITDFVSGNVTANTVIANNIIQYNAAVNNNTVTQLTSKSTAVTSNGRTGQITTNGAALNKGVAVQFTVNNSYIVSNKDVVILNIASGASVGYGISVNSVTPGSFQVNLHNSDSTPSGSNASDTLVINYAIIRVV